MNSHIANHLFQVLISLLFLVTIYIYHTQPVYVILLLLLWMSVLLPLSSKGEGALHLYFRKQAAKVLVRIREIYKQDQGEARVINYLRQINPFVFEELILLVFQEQGYQTIPNKRYTGDGGVDGRLNIYGNIWPIQAKRYGKHIKKEHIEQFDRLIRKRNYVGGIFIHTGRTSKDIIATYRSTTLIILSGSLLVDFLCSQESLTFTHILGFRGIQQDKYGSKAVKNTTKKDILLSFFKLK